MSRTRLVEDLDLNSECLGLGLGLGGLDYNTGSNVSLVSYHEEKMSLKNVYVTPQPAACTFWFLLQFGLVSVQLLQKRKCSMV